MIKFVELLESQISSYWNLKNRVIGISKIELLESQISSYWNLKYRVIGISNIELLESQISSFSILLVLKELNKIKKKI